MYGHKNFIVLSTISFILSIVFARDHRDDCPNYNKCDKQWANDKLWECYSLKENYKICDYNSLGKNFDGEFITLFANVISNKHNHYSTKNKYCRCEGDSCSPQRVNVCLTSFYFSELTSDLTKFFYEFGLGKFTFDLNIKNPEKAFHDDYEIIYKVKGEDNLYLATEIKHEGIEGVNTLGKKGRHAFDRVEHYSGWFPADDDKKEKLKFLSK